MAKISVYLDRETERKLAEIREAILSQISAYTPKISIDIDLSKSKIISLAIDRLHELVVGKPEKEEKPKQEKSTKNETERGEEKG
ncbi:hypothetical protein J7K52_06070 [Candidatus Bathyarchaeota archaeon]|nr:hypothetical protein [Candidatus Bathyarchaeota archaeon]